MKLNAMIGIRERRIAAPLAAALAAVCAATTALPSYADSITVAPVVDANGLETAFNLTLDVSATRYLCAAWAETDQGANYTAWTNYNFEVLGEVNAGTTSWSFAAPKGWGADMRALRFFLVEKQSRPYDTRVEWIESTGAEWINTGYVGGSEDHYWLHFTWFSGGAFPMAAIDPDSSNDRYAIVHMDGSKYGVALNTKYPTVGTSNGGDKFPNNRRAVVAGEEVYTHTQIKTGGGNQFIQVSTRGFDDLDGTAQTSYLSGATAAPRCTKPLYIFARNRTGASTDITQTGTTDGACAMRLWSCYATHNGTPVLDFIPCVKDGEAMLYERINNRLHRNVSGEGAFIAGPVVEEQLLGATEAASASVAPARPVALITTTSATTSAVSFSATLAQSASAVSATFAHGDSPDALGAAAEVSANWTQGAAVTFSATGLSAGARQYGVLALSQNGAVVRTYGFWFVAAGAEGRVVAVAAEKAGGEEIASGTFTTQGAYRTVALREVVESAGGETLCCKLDFGAAVQNETCRLVLAYGAEEGDVELSSWENCVVVGTIAPGENSLEYNLPAGLVTGAFKYRFYLVADGDSLPGVTGVPYIESTGNEWINTGWIGSYDDEYDISFRSLKPPSEWFMLGSYGPTIQGRYTVVQSAGGNVFALYFNISGNNTGIAAKQNVDYRLRASFAYGSQTTYVSEDGGESELAGELAVAANPANTMAPLYLFCRNCANSSVDNVAMARLYACSITHNGTLVRDFAPCVKNGEAGLYDRVSGHFHGNISGAGAFIAGDGSAAPAAVYSYTVPTNGVGVATDHASKAGAMTAISAVGQRVSATASVTALGLGDTYPSFEWWVDGGTVTNAIAFAAIPENDTAASREYSATFDAGDAWGQIVYCRFAVSNVYTSAAGGTCAWSDKSGARTVTPIDDCTYTWQDVNGDWNGDWTNAAHWVSDRPGNCIGIPTATSSVFFPTGSTSRVTMPDGLVEVNRLGIDAPGLSVEFFNASNATTLKPGGLAIAGNTTGEALNQTIVFDGVSLQKKQPSSVVCVCNASTYALRGGATINSTVVDMINTQNSGYTGRLEVGAGSRWPTDGEITTFRVGDEGVVRVDGTFNVKEFKIGQYGNWGGGTLEIGGTNPVVNVSKLLRCWNGNTYVNPSYVTFDIPAESWATAPLRGGAAADPLAGSAADSASVVAKMIISVPGDAAIIAARKGHRRPLKVPLISWPTGITVDRCELANDNPSHIRYAWTYGGTDSEVDDGNPPTGLVAYITGSGGMMLIVR